MLAIYVSIVKPKKDLFRAQELFFITLAEKAPQEAKLWNRLRNNRLGLKFRRQYLIANEYIADFACLEKNLMIEMDGSQHAESQADVERSNMLTNRGFTILRF